MILGLDIETYSAADIKDGADAYARHPSTGVHCAVWAGSSRRGEHTVARWFPGDRLPFWVTEGICRGVTVVAHNVSFEASILRHLLCPTHDWPKVATDQWHDTLLVAASLGLPMGLGGLGVALGARVLKDDEGHKLMVKLASVKKWDTGTPVFPKPAPAQLKRLAEYCELDVLSMLDCYWALPSQPVVEQEIVIVDREINERGLHIDQELTRAMQSVADERVEQLDSQVWAKTRDLFTVSDPGALKGWVKAQGVTLPTVVRKKKDGSKSATESLDKASALVVAADPETPQIVRDMLEIRVEVAKLTSLAKLKRVPDMVAPDGRLRYALRYCGAHTGRWSSKGLQVHNLAKSDFRLAGESKADGLVRAAAARDAVLRGDLVGLTAIWPNVLQALSMLLRSAITAAPGFELIGADYSAIEARVIAWLAGEQSVLDVFASGRDIYVEDAAAIGSQDRQLGKVQRLALAYGMGPIKFRDTAAGYGVELSLKRARQVQQLWRKNNPSIVQFWYDLQNAVAEAIHKKHDVKVGPLTFKSGKNCLRVMLPSGRALHYWRPHQVDVEREIETVNDAGEIETKTVKMRELRFFKAKGSSMLKESTYGGKLAENITQAIARDLLGHATKVVRDQGEYPCVVHVHDSLVAEVPTGTGSVTQFECLISQLPHWASGLPLEAEGYRSTFFQG